MSGELTPVLATAVGGAYVGGIGFTAGGIGLSMRERRLHPLLLICVAAISISWIEAPYDWAVYAQFDPAIPRMPSWWPLNMTWGGLPASVPLGYIEYFVLPALLAVWAGRRVIARRGSSWPITLLTVGFVVGFVWALLFNAVLGARLGVFYYARVIPHLAIFEGTKHQYPIYDAVAMGIQMMVFTYLLGRTDSEGRSVIQAWASRRSKGPVPSAVISLGGIVVIANVLYGALFGIHLLAKVQGWETSGPSGQLFKGVANQPFQGTDRGPRLG